MKKASDCIRQVIRRGASVLLLTSFSAPVHGDNVPPPGEKPPGNETTGTGWKWADKPTNPSPTRGVNGPNRRVAISQHGAIKGTFAEPNGWLNPNTVYQGHPDPNTNGLKSNKPTYYFGLNGGQTASEAGMQWEPEIPTRDISAGWVVFIRVTVTVPDKGQWHYWNNTQRIGKGTLKSTDLKLEPLPDGRLKIYAYSSGGGSLTLDPISARWPKTSNGDINVGGLIVRRIVGLTQWGGKWLAGTDPGEPGGPDSNRTLINQDGSWIENLHFIDGKIARLKSAGDGKLAEVQSGDYDTWPENSALNSQKLYPDTRKTASSPWVIDFMRPSKPRSKAAPGTYDTGFQTENVVIDLRTKSGIRSKPVRRSRNGF